MSFDLFYLGGEQGGWRTLLRDNGIENIGISYWSWSRRGLPKKIDIASYGFDGVLLESGGYQANSAPEKHSVREWSDYGQEYMAFVADHIDDLTLVTEFDCLALGPAWIKEQRSSFWSQIDPQKFLPVWHPEQGLPALEELGENYPRIAISESAVTGGGLNVTPHLNALARKGVKLHGIAMTKPTVLRQVAFATAASTSWLSPTRYGDTLVWDNNDLRRYPVKMKDQARRRHASLFEREGFDAAKILADDKGEVTRLTLWSWKQQEQALRALRSNSDAQRSYNDDGSAELANTSSASGDVVTGVHQRGNNDIVPVVLRERAAEDMVGIPMFGSVTTENVDETSGEVTTSLPLLEVRGTSARRCDTCAIATRCEKFMPQTTCAFNIPIEIKTKEQRAAFLTGMIEIQAQRVAFGVMVEQVNGGYPDPNLSQEYDRMLKAMQVQADLEDGRDFLKISVEAKGGGGLLSQLFGAGPAARAAHPIVEHDAQDTDRLAHRVLEGRKVT